MLKTTKPIQKLVSANLYMLFLCTYISNYEKNKVQKRGRLPKHTKRIQEMLGEVNEILIKCIQESQMDTYP